MTWWTAESTWAPQSGPVRYTREQDWAVMAWLENDAHPSAETAADVVGLAAESFKYRANTLRFFMDQRHWR